MRDDAGRGIPTAFPSEFPSSKSFAGSSRTGRALLTASIHDFFKDAITRSTKKRTHYRHRMIEGSKACVNHSYASYSNYVDISECTRDGAFLGLFIGFIFGNSDLSCQIISPCYNRGIQVALRRSSPLKVMR